MSEVQEQCIEAVQHLNVWRRRGERAPHKPLLVLFALSRAMRSSERLIPFKELSDPFKKLLSDHPKPASDYHLKTGQRE